MSLDSLMCAPPGGTVVCGIDRSRHALAARRVALRFAERTGARLVFLHTAPPPDVPPSPAARPRMAARLVEAAPPARGGEERLLEGAARGVGRGVATPRLEHGPAARRLTDAAEHERAVLVVVAARGEDTPERGPDLLGGTATEVLRTARCPVMVVPAPVAGGGEPGLAGERVVCAVRDDRDGPTASIAALLADALGLELTFAHVLPGGIAPVSPGPVAPSSATGATPQKLALRQLKMVLDAVTEERPALEGRCDLRLRRGDPGQQLQALCEEGQAALAVVGSSRRGPIAAALLGSVARDVAGNGTVPVVVTPHGAHPATWTPARFR